MDINLDSLPIIDWEQGKKLAGNNASLADEILGMLIQRLEKDLALIKELNEKSLHEALRNEVHKLHGAVCYCGTPRLKATLMRLETDLKTNIMSDLPYLLDQLSNEVHLVLTHYHRSGRRNGVDI
jgi:two-component system sensor histidine kinase BarA